MSHDLHENPKPIETVIAESRDLTDSAIRNGSDLSLHAARESLGVTRSTYDAYVKSIAFSLNRANEASIETIPPERRAELVSSSNAAAEVVDVIDGLLAIISEHLVPDPSV